MTQVLTDSGSSLWYCTFFSLFFAKEHMWVFSEADIYVRKTDICLMRDERTTDADTHFAFWKDNYLAGGCSSLMSTNRLLLYKQLSVVWSRLQGFERRLMLTRDEAKHTAQQFGITWRLSIRWNILEATLNWQPMRFYILFVVVVCFLAATWPCIHSMNGTVSVYLRRLSTNTLCLASASP